MQRLTVQRRIGIVENHEDCMDRTIFNGGRLQFLVITVLLLLLPFGWYYFIYVSGQQAYLTDRNFRLLGLTSRQIQARLDYLNLAWNQMNTESASSSAGTTKEVQDTFKKFKDTATREINRISGLEKAHITFELTLDKKETIEKFKVERKGDTVEAYFRFQYPQAIRFENTDKDSKPCEQDECFIQINARSNLASLLTPLVNRPEFNDVLVVLQQESQPDVYEVIFQRESRGIQVLTLPLPVQKSQSRETNPQSRSNRLETIELGGARYKIFWPRS